MDMHFREKILLDLSIEEKKPIIFESISVETSKEKWIIDGNYPSHTEALALRMEKADLVFYLNMPLEFCIESVKKRGISDIENALDTEESVARLVGLVENYEAKNNNVKHAINKHASDKSIEFNCRNEVNKFIERLLKDED
jgi:adenylate kinase family enzyme